jgi:nucleoside-diphosphate-sugar epimerase
VRVFIAGASGVLGVRLVRLLTQRGDTVFGMTRTPGKLAMLEQLGARPVLADALDPSAVGRAISEAEPNVVVHQMTAISEVRSMRDFEKEFAPTARLRSEGTDVLLSASKAAGVETFVAQSYAGFLLAPGGKMVLSESDPLDPEPHASVRRLVRANLHLERVVTSASWTRGIALRYGSFYGPGTSISRNPPGLQSELARKRQYPVVGSGAGLTSFIHIDDAASATVAAIDRGQRGIYHITDNEPAPYAVWLPGLAAALGAKPPIHVPKWIGRLAAGPAAVVMMTESRGASNDKARRELGWEPRYRTWREGFVYGLV